MTRKLNNENGLRDKISSFVDFCSYEAKEFDKVKKEFHELFKVGDDIREFEEVMKDANLKKGNLSSEATSNINGEQLLWFGKDCDNGTSWASIFLVDSNNIIVRKDITLQLSSDNFFSHNVPFSLKYFASSKRIEEILSYIFEHKKINDLDNFMLSAGAKKVKEEDTVDYGSTKKISYKYCINDGLFLEYIGKTYCYNIDLYTNAKKEVLKVKSNFIAK